jgi:hypothetical protein
MTNKVVLWVGGVITALLIAVVVVVLVLVNTLNTQAENDSYQECMASMGFERGAAPEMPKGGIEEYAKSAAEAAEFCSR